MPALHPADHCNCDVPGACLIALHIVTVDAFSTWLQAFPSLLCPLLQVFDHLVIKSAASPVAQNMGGSYLTMFSKGGFVFWHHQHHWWVPTGNQAGWLAAEAVSIFVPFGKTAAPICSYLSGQGARP